MAVNGALVILALAVSWWYRARLRRLPLAAGPTWGCGYLAPTPRMQYTGSSFSEMEVNQLGALVAPLRRRPALGMAVFPGGARFRYEATESILDRVLTPAFHLTGQAFSHVRRLQHGRLHIYVLYFVATLFALMLWAH
jgi:hydrogenase-4 component B